MKRKPEDDNKFTPQKLFLCGKLFDEFSNHRNYQKHQKACPNRPEPGTLNINSYCSHSRENRNASATVFTAVQRVVEPEPELSDTRIEVNPLDDVIGIDGDNKKCEGVNTKIINGSFL